MVDEFDTLFKKHAAGAVESLLNYDLTDSFLEIAWDNPQLRHFIDVSDENYNEALKAFAFWISKELARYAAS